jgi:hypothetical protein
MLPFKHVLARHVSAQCTLFAVLFTKRYLYYMYCCEMWFVLYCIGGDIVCCVTGVTGAEGV